MTGVQTCALPIYVFYVVYQYDREDLSREDVTLDMIKSTPEYKSLEDMGLEMNSSSKQIKNID